MISKIYSITGFDCPNCAAKAESFLATQENVDYVHLDYSQNKLYITYKNEEWSVKKLASVIKKVESDPLEIALVGDGKHNSSKIFTSKMWIMLSRIIFAVVIALICIFGLGKQEYQWIRFSLYIVAIIVIGYDIFYKVINHIKNKNNILDHNLLITIAAIGSLAIAIIALIEGEDVIHRLNDNYTIAFDDCFEAVMVITLFQIGTIIENVATNKSKAAIMSAVELRVDKANLITSNGLEVVSPDKLKVDDHIFIKVGELIPVDGVIIDGEGYIDTSSLTGEYVPVRACTNNKVTSGCLLKEGSITVKVEKEFKDSTVSKIIELIEHGGEKKSKADEFIAKFAKIYTPIVVILALVVFVFGGLISSLINKDNTLWLTWLHTGLEVLVIGCPCAIVISVPLAYFSAIGLASKHGIVVKGGNYIDSLANMGKLITDKTGTLTHGSFTIQKIETFDIDKELFLDYLIAIESLSTHPIGKAIVHDYKKRKTTAKVKYFNEIAGLGCVASVKDKQVIAGNDKLLDKYKITFNPCNENGSIVYLVIDKKCVGYVVLSDTIKEDAQPMVDLLHSQGVEIILLTGDNEENAKEICSKLGIDRYHYKLLPEDKTNILEKEMENTDKSVAFIGDGINDAPSIIRSDVGIAMGGIGSDIAVENADMIIMNDDPAKVYDAMIIAKKGKRTSIFNICFALTIKLVVFVLALIFKDERFMMYVAILADTGLTVLLVINSLLLLYHPIKRKIKNV